MKLFKRGFTLIEMLAVLILLGMLVVIAISSIGFLTKQKEADIMDVKLKNLSSSIELYIDSKGNTYKDRNFYTYCIKLPTFIKETSYKNDDFLDMFDVTSPDSKVIKIDFKNNSNFDIDVVDSANCTQGKREEDLGIVKNFGGNGNDFIKDVVPYEDGYYIVGMTDSTSGDFSMITSVRGDNEAFIARTDKDFNILDYNIFAGLGSESFEKLIIDGSDIYAFGWGDADSNNHVFVPKGDVWQTSLPSGPWINNGADDVTLLVKYNLNLDRIDVNYVAMPTAEFGNIQKLADGFFVSFTFYDGAHPTFISKGQYDIGMYKVSFAGAVSNVLSLGSTLDDDIDLVTSSPNGDIFMTLDIRATTGDFSGLTSTDGVIAKISSSGTVSFIKNHGGYVYDLKYLNNHLYATGYSEANTGIFAGKTCSPYECLFAMKLDNNLSIVDSYVLDSNSYAEGRSLVVNSSGIYLNGWTDASSDVFGNLNPNGSSIYFDMKLNHKFEVESVVKSSYTYMHMMDTSDGIVAIGTDNTDKLLTMNKIDYNLNRIVEKTLLNGTDINRALHVYDSGDDFIATSFLDTVSNDFASYPIKGYHDTYVLSVTR